MVELNFFQYISHSGVPGKAVQIWKSGRGGSLILGSENFGFIFFGIKVSARPAVSSMDTAVGEGPEASDAPTSGFFPFRRPPFAPATGSRSIGADLKRVRLEPTADEALGLADGPGFDFDRGEGAEAGLGALSIGIRVR